MKEVQEYFLHPGYIFASRDSYMIPTILGSCVAVCLWDSVNRFGGISHYIYSKKNRAGKLTSKYGNVSIPYLINMMKKFGSETKNLRAHIIGGAENPDMDSYVGRKNVAMAQKVLKKYKIPIVSQDVGGTMGRKVIFNNWTGETLICKVQKIDDRNWYV